MGVKDNLLRQGLGFATVEEETTYDVDPSSSPTPILLASQPDLPEPDREQNRKTRVKATGGRVGHRSTGMRVSGSFETLISPIPFADDATPQIAPILKGSGFTEKLAGSTASAPIKATYTPNRNEPSSYTLKLYQRDKESDGFYTRMTLTGVRSNLSFDWSRGDECVVTVDYTGTYSEWSAIQDLSADEPTLTDYPADEPFQFQDLNQFYHGAVDTDISTFAFDPANEPQNLNSANAEDGDIEEWLDTAQKDAGGGYDPYATSVGATDDAHDMRRSDTKKDLLMELAEGSNTEKHFFVECDDAQVTDAPFTGANRVYRKDVSYICNESAFAGDDEYELRWERDS